MASTIKATPLRRGCIPVVRESRSSSSNVEGEPDCVEIYNGVDSELWMSNSEVEVMNCYRNYAIQNDHADRTQVFNSLLYVSNGGNVNCSCPVNTPHVTLMILLVQAYSAPQNLGDYKHRLRAKDEQLQG